MRSTSPGRDDESYGLPATLTPPATPRSCRPEPDDPDESLLGRLQNTPNTGLEHRDSGKYRRNAPHCAGREGGVVRVEAEFTPELASPRAARRFVDGVLREFGCAPDLAVLLVSELATNAVLHARTDFLVRLVIDNDRGHIRIETEDANERPPTLAHTPAEATSGRGLQLVQTLADAWGVEGRPDGKVVWFELPIAPSHDDRYATAAPGAPRSAFV